MPCALLTWTPHAESQGNWLKEMLLACGFDVVTAFETEPTQGMEMLWNRADSFYGVGAAEPSGDSPFPSSRPSKPFIEQVQMALKRKLHTAILVDSRINIPVELQEKC